METTLNKDLGSMFWNSRSRATVLFTFLVEICDTLENLTLNRKFRSFFRGTIIKRLWRAI